MGEGNAVRTHKRACVQSQSQRLAEGDMKEEEEEEGLQLLLCMPYIYALHVCLICMS